MKLWDAATGDSLETLPHQHGVDRVAYSPNGQLLATSQPGGTVTIWNLTSRQQVSTVQAHPAVLTSLVFSRDGQTLTTTFGAVYGDEERKVKLWDVHSLELKDAIPCENQVDSLAYSADGRRLAMGHRIKGTVKVLDVLQQAKTVSIRCDPLCIAFSRNGRMLISAGEGGLKFWDVASGDLRFTLNAQDEGIRSIAVSPDGRTLATGSTDDTVMLWRVATDEDVEVMRRRWLETRE